MIFTSIWKAKWELRPSITTSLFNAAATQCTVREAEAHIAAFKASLPAVGAWMERLVGRGGEDEWVATLGGRRRYFRNLKSGKEGERDLFCHPPTQGAPVNAVDRFGSPSADGCNRGCKTLVSGQEGKRLSRSWATRVRVLYKGFEH